MRLVHDAKPDYELIGSEKNSDLKVKTVWKRFDRYGLNPHPAANVRRVGFHGKCDPNHVNILAGCRASDLSPLMLAGFFFPETNEQLQFEGFASAADSIGLDRYSLNDILQVVQERMEPNADPTERISCHNWADYTTKSSIPPSRNAVA